MKILVSAFACLPNTGSEGGVGWRWAKEWAKEHDVVVITDIYRSQGTKDYLAEHPISNPRIIFYRPWLLRWVPINAFTVQILYQFWQIGLLAYVRRLHALERFDLAHHVSYGVFRQPSLLGHAGIPLIFGPVGGGEDAPWRLKRSLSPAQRFREFLRTSVNRFAKVDPFLRWGLSACSLILAKTRATADAMPSGFEERTRIALEIGTEEQPGVAPHRAPKGRPIRLLYAGRLIGLKGIHLGLDAVAQARAWGVNVEFHIVGDGPYEERLRQQVQRLGLEAMVHWRRAMPQAELFELYRQMDAVLFPSLHDSSGNVVVEALSFALPVICLDLGGPADIVTQGSGWVVNTAGCDEGMVVVAMAEAIRSLASDSELFERLSVGALERATQLSWNDQIERVKALALSCVGQRMNEDRMARSVVS